MRDSYAEVAFDHRSEHGEGPLWSAEDRTLLWVDQYRGLVQAGSIDSGEVVTVADVGAPIGAIVPATSRRWAVAAGPGFALVDDDGTAEPIAAVLPDDGVERRMNDAKAAPDGSFWAGSMAMDKRQGAGSLYRLRGREAEVVLTGLTIANGLAWSADAMTLHFIDTPTGTVRRFALGSDGLPVDSEVLVRIDPEVGVPDGMCIDAEGALWVAVWGAGAVHRYDARGRLLERVVVDAPQVSSCCFGGEDLTTLFITTSQEGYDEAESQRRPDAGRVFAARTGTAGLPPQRYAG